MPRFSTADEEIEGTILRNGKKYTGTFLGKVDKTKQDVIQAKCDVLESDNTLTKCEGNVYMTRTVKLNPNDSATKQIGIKNKDNTKQRIIISKQPIEGNIRINKCFEKYNEKVRGEHDPILYHKSEETDVIRINENGKMYIEEGKEVKKIITNRHTACDIDIITDNNEKYNYSPIDLNIDYNSMSNDNDDGDEEEEDDEFHKFEEGED